MYDHIPKHTQKIKGSSNRSFGFLFTVVFVIIGLYPLTSGNYMRSWPLMVAGGSLTLAVVCPDVLAPINRLWMKFGELLHGMVSPIALGIVFYLAVMPTGLLMRMLGKDPLRLRIDITAESYWIQRDPSGPSAESLKDQF